MPQIAFQGPVKEIAEIEEALEDCGLEGENFTSKGFDGSTVATFIIDLATIVVPSVTAVIAANMATKKQIVVKIDGIEVHANSKEEAMDLIGGATNPKPSQDG